MELSIATAANLVKGSSSLEDDTKRYDYNVKQVFTFEEKMQDDDKIYVWVNPSYVPIDWVQTDEDKYEVGDILYKDSKVQVLKSKGERWVPKQPEFYSLGVDNGFDFSTWSQYYSKLMSGVDIATFTGYTHLAGTTTHHLYKDHGSPTNWTYRLSWDTVKEQWSHELYGNPQGYIYQVLYHHATGVTEVYYEHGAAVVTQTTNTPPTPYDTIFTASNGYQYRAGAHRTHDAVNGIDIYNVQHLMTWTESKYTDPKYVNVYTHVTEDSIITSAQCLHASKCNDVWVGGTFIIRNGDLYVRTHVGSAELLHIINPVYEVAEQLKILESYGFVYLEPTRPYVMLDNKNYTKFDASGEVSFEIKSEGQFNTIAFGGVIADTIDVLFKDANGNQVADVNDYTPTNNRDKNFKLPDYKSTAIIYSYDDNNNELKYIPTGGTATVTLKGTYIELGTVQLGLSVNAGFTNLVFQNEFIDLSPVEKDQWHNITYVKGLRINVHSGTVDIPIQEYDMINRLMISIGGETVILNGSSSTDNTPPTSGCIFASTMILGRMENIKLATKMKDKELGDMATYTFKIVENV